MSGLHIMFPGLRVPGMWLRFRRNGFLVSGPELQSHSGSLGKVQVQQINVYYIYALMVVDVEHLSLEVVGCLDFELC